MDIESTGLGEKLLKAIKEIGFTELTPIQAVAIPEILAGKDVIGQSSTGSGKTAAFALPILEKAHAGKGVQALILTPTRELCMQVAVAISDFGRHTGLKVAAVYGGVGMGPQIDGIKRAEIVVGTPGRILDHMQQGTLKLDKAKFLVLDEMDRMCDMGFLPDVGKITRAIPRERQTLLFSATYTPDVDRYAAEHMNSPLTVSGEHSVDPALLHQVYYDVSQDEKFSVLVHLLKKNTMGLSMIFCGTRREVDILARNLQKNGIEVMALHGGLTQGKRTRALDMLRKQHIDVLVATDVVARGMDIKEVFYIYNWDVPPTADEYVHRIGRTARAGKNGLAITLLAPRDHMNFRMIMRADSAINLKNEPTPEIERLPYVRRFEHSHSERGSGAWPRQSHRGRGNGFQRNQGARGFGQHTAHRGSGTHGFGAHTAGEGAGAGQAEHPSTHAGHARAHSSTAHGHTREYGQHRKAYGAGGHHSYMGSGASHGGRPYGRRGSGTRGFGAHSSDFAGLSSADFRDVSSGTSYRRRGGFGRNNDRGRGRR